MPAQGLKCLQANLQHSKVGTYLLGKRFREEAADIAFIQEPWLARNGKISGLGNASGKIIAHCPGERPRAGILVRNNLTHFVLSGFCTRDVVTVQVNIPLEGGGSLNILGCSAYLPGDSAEPPPADVVRKLVAYSKRERMQLVVACDANAHHTAWGSSNTNQRGESLFDFITGESLTISNRGTEPTFVTRNRQEVLDITFCTALLSNKILDWKVSDTPSGSDHRNIQFNIECDHAPVTEYRNPRCTRWGGYAQSLQMRLAGTTVAIRNREDVEAAAAELQRHITTSYHENCPLKRKKDSRGAPWWNRALENSRKEVRRLFNRAKELGNWDEYRNTLTAYNRDIRRAKRESWRRFCESISDTRTSARIHKSLQRQGTKPWIAQMTRRLLYPIWKRDVRDLSRDTLPRMFNSN